MKDYIINNIKNYVINSFILQKKNSIVNIYEYIKLRYNKSVELTSIKIALIKMEKNKILFLINKIYELTNKGHVILNDHTYYYSRIIIHFFRKYTKKQKLYALREIRLDEQKLYALKEIRLEQQKLRTYLINNKEQKCIMCDKHLPLCLLETAHLKPRCLLNSNEMNDNNIVEFMCRYCHNLYDNGYLGLYNGLLHVSSLIDNYDLQYNKNTLIVYYNILNKKYFNFHYNYIYKMGV